MLCVVLFSVVVLVVVMCCCVGRREGRTIESIAFELYPCRKENTSSSPSSRLIHPSILHPQRSVAIMVR